MFFFFDFFISLNQRFSGWCLIFCGFPSSNKEWRNNFIKLYLHLLYWLFLGMDFDFQLLGMPEIGRFEGLELFFFATFWSLDIQGSINYPFSWNQANARVWKKLRHFHWIVHCLGWCHINDPSYSAAFLGGTGAPSLRLCLWPVWYDPDARTADSM